MPYITKKVYAPIDVVNIALTAMGENRISNLETDSTVSAIVMREHWDLVWESCLTRTTWRFATATAALSKLSFPPIDEWAASWQLPPDMLVLLTTYPASNYEVQGDRLLSNEQTALRVEYIRKVQLSLWPGYFTRCVALQLAIDTVKGITGTRPGSTDLPALLQDALAQAMFQDAQQQPNQTMLPNAFIDVRL